MINPKLLKAFEDYDSSSIEQPEYQEALISIHNFFLEEKEYEKTINILLNRYENDDYFMDAVLESFFKFPEIHIEQLKYILFKIFDLSKKNKDDFNLLYIAMDYDTEIDDNSKLAVDFYQIIKPFSKTENPYITSACIYLINSFYDYLASNNQQEIKNYFEDLSKHTDWKKRFIVYSYLKNKGDFKIKISLIDKIRGAFTKGIEEL